jgi:hypothetical protein
MGKPKSRWTDRQASVTDMSFYYKYLKNDSLKVSHALQAAIDKVTQMQELL